MSTLALMADDALLALKALFLVGLYAFVWMVVRVVIRVPTGVSQESIVIGGAEARELREALLPTVRLRVLASADLRVGESLEVRGTMAVGRAPGRGLVLEEDTAVSARHATLDSRADGLWVTDVGSTNGTFVNDVAVTAPRAVARGDVIRLGQTVLVVEG